MRRRALLSLWCMLVPPVMAAGAEPRHSSTEALIKSVAVGLNPEAPLFVKKQAVGTLYGLVKEPSPDSEFGVDQELLQPERLKALVEVAALRDDPAASVAKEMLDILQARSSPGSAVPIAVVLQPDGRWKGTLSLGERAWLALAPRSFGADAEIVWEMKCPGGWGVYQPTEVEGRVFGIPLGHADVQGQQVAVHADIGKPLWLQHRSARPCNDVSSTLQFREAAQPLAGRVTAPGRFRGELHGKPLAANLKVEHGKLYTLATGRLSGSLDTKLSIYSPGGQLITENDDAGPDPEDPTDWSPLASRITWVAPADGEVTVEVSQVDADEGSFELRLRAEQQKPQEDCMVAGAPADAGIIETGRRFTAAVPSTGIGYIAFKGTAGCSYRVSSEGLRTEVDEPAKRALAIPTTDDPLLGLLLPRSALPSVAVFESGKVVMRLSTTRPTCKAEAPWCDAASTLSIEEETLGDAPAPCARPRAFTAATSRHEALKPEMEVADYRAWLDLGKPARPVFIRIPGAKGGELRAACTSPQPGCRVRVYRSDETTPQETATSKDGSGVSLSLPATGTYLMQVAPAGSGAVGLWFDRERTHDSFKIGDCVILGKHEMVNGDSNWVSPMADFVGRSTRITSLRARDVSGSWIARVEADHEKWSWRTRNMTRSSACASKEAVPAADE
jgi:hypothetical protein